MEYFDEGKSNLVGRVNFVPKNKQKNIPQILLATWTLWRLQISLK